METAFEHLIYPVTRSQFFSEFFEKKALHLVNRPRNYYESLFSVPELERLLWEHEELLLNFVRVHCKGSDETPSRSIGRLDLFRWVSERYRSGSTVVVNNLDRLNLVVAKYLRGMEIVFESRVSASAYLTPPSSQGFKIHFDTHDVFIIQISGSKTYTLYEESHSFELPLKRHQREVKIKDLVGAESVISLESGDMLYIPRGMIHVASTGEQNSLHISIGTHGYKVVDAIKKLFDIAADTNLDLRKSWLLQDAGHSKIFDDICKLVSDTYNQPLSRAEINNAFTMRLISELRGFPSNDFPDNPSKSLELNDLVVLREGAMCVVTIQDGVVRLGVSGLEVIHDENKQPASLEIPLASIEVLQFIADQKKSFCARDLPDCLSEAAKLQLLEMLLEEKLLRRN